MTHLQSVFGSLAESNQQQQQQQQQMPQQSQNFCQPMQTKPNGFFNQQAGNLCQTQQPQPMQQSYNNPFLTTNQVPQASMPCHNPFGQTMPAPPTNCYLPPSLLDQLRSLASSNATPIFILPAASSSNSSTPCFSPTCIPYPMPLPVYHPFGAKSSSSESDCKCTSNGNGSSNGRSKSQSHDSLEEPLSGGIAWNSEHVCKESNEGAVCSKKNCPASIQLQAMISQLLAIQGVVPSAITRILLKRVPGSNVADSVDEIMEKAMRCIRQLPKDGLLRESCNSREVTKLLGLYLTSSSTLPRIIPVLTTVQLKCNVLKAMVENLVSSRLMEEQNCGGVESEEPLDRLLLELKPEDELRQTLGALRERECEERVNASFAACASQRRIAEARLAAVQRKIQQVEAEMLRRRELSADQERCDSLKDSVKSNKAASRHLSSLICGDTRSSKSIREQCFDSPDPFAALRVSSPKRLLLKPHVGSPETTYDKPSETCKIIPSEVEVRTDDCDASRDDDAARDAEGVKETE